MEIDGQVIETITFRTEDRMRSGALGYDGNISDYDLEIRFH